MPSTTKKGRPYSNSEGLDWQMQLGLKKVTRAINNRIISWPRTEAEQSSLNVLIRRMQNRLVSVPRQDHGEYAMLEKVRRVLANRVISLPRTDHGEFALLEDVRVRNANRIVNVPRADHGEFSMLENVRRLLANRVVSLPRQDHGEFGLLEKIRYRLLYGCWRFGTIANGSTAGKLKTTTDVEYSIAGQNYIKAASDDLWDLSAFSPDTGVGEYQAVILWLDSGGTASTSKLTIGASEAAANAYIEAALAANTTKSCIGVYTAGPSTDWNAAGGLAGQGTIVNGAPAGIAPAAITAEAETLIADGSTAGKFKLVERIAYTNDGLTYYKAATDDLWDLTGETNNGAAEYAGHWLLLDGGTASVVSTAKVASAAAALTALAAAIPTGKAIVGAFVSGLSCNFSLALTAQGTLYQSIPEACIPAAVTAETATLVENGGTAGNIKLSNHIDYMVRGQAYSKDATDDFWDLSALTDVAALKYRAVLLTIDGTTAEIVEGTDQDSSAAAIAEVAALYPTDAVVVAMYVADPSCDWDNAGGLAGQGTYYQSPTEAMVPAAVTAETETIIADGSTNGKFKLLERIAYTNDNQPYYKAATDDLWDLTGETNNGAAEYAGHFLCLDGGTASVVSTAKVASANAALAALGALIPTGKAVVGAFVSGLSCNFANALTAQGTLYQGFPEGAIMAAVTAEAESLVGDGGTNGKFKLKERIAYLNDGAIYWKAATDDLWDLSAETDTLAGKYRAYALTLDGGTAAFTKHTTDAASAAAALTALYATPLPAGKCPVAVYVAGPSTDFNGVAGLEAQGTLYDWAPEGLSVSEATVESSTLLADGSTAGKIKLSNAIRYTIDGVPYTKAATDDLWNLSAETDTASGYYRAYNLFLDTSGTATAVAGADKTTEAEAIASAFAVRMTDTYIQKALVGVYVAGSATDFNGVAGLDNYGTYYDGQPSGYGVYEVNRLV